MNRTLITMAMLALLTACKPQQDPATNTSPTTIDAVAVAAPREPARPAGAPFQTPLPQGVVLKQPHNAGMDVPVPNAKGAAGRRTEFEYLDGDAVQAMREFSEAMVAVGFVSANGPVVEKGVVRQVFRKPGYGAVFARAQAEDPARRKHVLARGFVVVAWPPDDGKSAVATN